MTGKTIALRLDPETRARLDLLAEATGYSPATLVAEAVRRFVDAELTALAAMQEEDGQERNEAGPSKHERWNLII